MGGGGAGGAGGGGGVGGVAGGGLGGVAGGEGGAGGAGGELGGAVGGEGGETGGVGGGEDGGVGDTGGGAAGEEETVLQAHIPRPSARAATRGRIFCANTPVMVITVNDSLAAVVKFRTVLYGFEFWAHDSGEAGIPLWAVWLEKAFW